MHVSNLLFVLIIITFSVICAHACMHYRDDDTSVSYTLQSNDMQMCAVIGFFALSPMIVCYEYNRQCIFSLAYMCVILVGLCGVIITPVRCYMHHYSFATSIIIASVLFMQKNCCNMALAISLIVQLLLLSNIAKHAIDRNVHIFSCQMLLIANFVFFYSYLHYLKYL
jgi:hypothetical protein